MNIQYVKPLHKGHQYKMLLIPSSCDLEIAVVERYLKITEDISGSVGAFTFDVSKIENNYYIINVYLTKNILQIAKLNAQLSFLNGTMFLPKMFLPDPSLEQIAEAAPTVTDTFTGLIGGSFAGTLALGATASLWSIIAFQQFIGYFAYINIEYPPHVEIFLEMMRTSMWDRLPNPAAYVTESLYKKILGEGIDTDLVPPKKFVKYEMTSFFIENGSTILLTNLSLLLLLLLVLSLKRIESLKENKILKTIKVFLKWNVISRTYLENAVPLALAIFLQLTALSMKGAYYIICTIMGLFSAVYLGAFTAFLFRILNKRENKLLEMKLIRRIFGTLYEGVILKDAAKYYHLVILMRGILVVFLVTMVDSFPTLQIVPLIFYNAGFVYYLFSSVTMEDSKLNIIIRIKEILILIGEIGILFLSFQLDSEGYYKNLGWAVVGFLFLALLIEVGYMLILQILGIKEIYRKIVAFYQKASSILSDCFGKKTPKDLSHLKIKTRDYNEASMTLEPISY